jgi:hypothetical protein
MPQFWNDTLSILGGLASALIILDFLGAREWLRKMKPWARVRVLLLFVSLAAFSIGMYGKYTSSTVTEKNVEQKIRGWIDAFSLQVQRRDSPACYFAFEVTLPTTIPVGVVRTKEHDHYITLVARVSLAPEHKALFDKLSNVGKMTFLFQLQLEAAKAKIALTPDKTLETLTIEKRIPIASTLTEGNLIESIQEVNFSAIIIRNTVGLKLDELAQREVKPP